VNIKEIKIKKYPVILYSDSHCFIENIIKLNNLYPKNQFICLGDIVNLFDKSSDLNKNAIDFQIKSGTLTIKGNHEQHLLSCGIGDSLHEYRVLPRFDEHSSLFDNYNIENEHLQYLNKLPDGVKIYLNNGDYYSLWHNRKGELWSFTEENTLTKKQFCDIYGIDEKCLGVIHGHGHKAFVVDYGIKAKRYQLGALKYNEYTLLTEKGIEFKKL